VKARGYGRYTALAVSVLLLAALAAYVAKRFSLTTDVTLLLPAGDDREVLSIVARIADSELARSMVLAVQAPDRDTAVAASRAFEAELRAEPRVKKQLDALEGGPTEGSERAVYELYQPRRLAFFADTPERARTALSEDALRESAQRLKQQLAQPMSPLVSQIAPSDPTLSLLRLFERVQAAQGNALALQDGRFVARDAPFAVLFVRTHARAFDSRAQAPFLQGIAAAFARVNARFDHTLQLDQSGANRFAVRMEETINADMTRVSTLSTVGLALVMFLLFRSVRLLLIAAVPLGAGMLAGLGATLAVYGNVHGVTLAFGASLLGVALDYVEHLYCHHAVAPHPGGPAATLRAIGPALVTGAVTTLIGFMALAGSGFRGLEEVALFSSVGLCAALLTTFTMLPALLPESTPAVAFRTRLVARLGRFFAAMRRKRSRLWILPAAALVFSAVGLSRARMSQDFLLGQLDPELLAEDQRVRDRVMRFEQARFVLAIGDTEELALQVNDQVAQRLEEAVVRGELAGYQSVARLLPSAARQQAVEAAVRTGLGDGANLLHVFSEQGFRSEAFKPFVTQLAAPSPEPLRYADLLRSPVASLVRPFRVTLGHRVAFLTFLSGVKTPAALAQSLAPIGGARFLDQQAQLKSAYLSYQSRALELLIVGTLGVLVLLALRYRDLRKTLAAFLPSVLGSLVTIAWLGWLGRGIDLVALAALLMVVSMGVDYGVFLVDASASEQAPESETTVALLSVLLAATTTVLGFGLLALSQHPMLRTIGLTAWVGMTACALLAPTALVLLGERAQGANS
jgi:predicted exporter